MEERKKKRVGGAKRRWGIFAKKSREIRGKHQAQDDRKQGKKRLRQGPLKNVAAEITRQAQDRKHGGKRGVGDLFENGGNPKSHKSNQSTGLAKGPGSNGKKGGGREGRHVAPQSVGKRPGGKRTGGQGGRNRRKAAERNHTKEKVMRKGLQGKNSKKVRPAKMKREKRKPQTR